MNWKTLLASIVPLLMLAGQLKKSEDDNDTGTDDIIGNTMIYVGQLITWIVGGATGAAPQPPAALNQAPPTKRLFTRPGH